MEVSVNGGIKEASIVERSYNGYFLKKRPNVIKTSNIQKKLKIVPSTNKSLGGVLTIKNIRRTRSIKYIFILLATKKYTTKVREQLTIELLSSTNNPQVDTSTTTKVRAQYRVLKLPRLKDQTNSKSENLEIQPKSQLTNKIV